MDQSVVRKGFFEQDLPSRIILWSFLLVTLPFALALVLTGRHGFLFLYVWLFGTTHFVLTGTTKPGELTMGSPQKEAEIRDAEPIGNG